MCVRKLSSEMEWEIIFTQLQIPLLQFCKIAQVVPLKRDVIQEPENKHRTWCNQILKQNLY